MPTFFLARLVIEHQSDISREIDQPELIFSYLQQGSQTRDLDFSRVTRVDVIAFQPELDYLGKYDFYTDGIILTWRNDVSSRFANWWRKIRTELTFYHEVGHHHYQHSEGGQVQEQEKEANDYKVRMFRNAHGERPLSGPCELLVHEGLKRLGSVAHGWG